MQTTLISRTKKINLKIDTIFQHQKKNVQIKPIFSIHYDFQKKEIGAYEKIGLAYEKI